MGKKIGVDVFLNKSIYFGLFMFDGVKRVLNEYVVIVKLVFLGYDFDDEIFLKFVDLIVFREN